VWSTFKNEMVALVGVSRDALHAHVGMALFLVIALALRRQRWALLVALGAVLAAEIANEVSDAIDSVRSTGEPNLTEALRDLLSTLLWPTILTIVGELRRWLLRARSAQ